MVSKPSTVLRDILNRIHTATQKKKKSLVVFDLDSTLFDVSPRIEKILQDFGNNKKFQERFPGSCEILRRIETQRSDWGVKDALIRAGLDGHHPDLHEAIREFWQKNFFSDEYLKCDLPYEGALEYVQEVFAAGADIVYLTGRDIQRMGTGTLKILKKWKFPLDEQRAQLVLKPAKGMNDAKFKSDYFAEIKKGVYQQIWLFENEPTNIHLVRDEHQHIEIVFFDSTHSRKSEPPHDLPKIMHYLLD